MTITVQRQAASKSFAIYTHAGTVNGHAVEGGLIEGGFYSKAAAIKQAEITAREFARFYGVSVKVEVR